MIVARDLLGRTLASDLGGERVSGLIVETEAYLGVHDAASHAWRYRRRRATHGVFAPADTWYVYQSYGIHWCLNITAPTGDDGAAVLIRALVPRTGLEAIRARRGAVLERHLANGPGKVGQLLALTGAENGMRHTRRSALRLTSARRIAGSIDVTPRIGISQAVEWPLRFLLRVGR